jgi:hypothetical protein
MERFDSLEAYMDRTFTKAPKRERPTYCGEILYDNQDLCMMLNVSKRTLQRYRSYEWLDYKQIDQKIYYLQSEVERFITERFEKRGRKVKDLRLL